MAGANSINTTAKDAIGFPVGNLLTVVHEHNFLDCGLARRSLALQRY